MTYDLPLPISTNDPKTSRHSDKEIIEAYERCKSVWGAGKHLGISGQLVSRRLARAGYVIPKRFITEAERASIRKYYTTTAPGDFDLTILAAKLGRSKHLVAREAGKMGLTDQRRPNSDAVINNLKIVKANQWTDRQHPRGMAGKPHSEETRAVLSVAARKNWATWKTFSTGPMKPEILQASRKRMSDMMVKRLSVTPERVHTRARGGKRPDLNDLYVRSSWEANYARYLNLLKKIGVVVSWQYEPKTFWFPVKRGVVTYKPDFLVFFKGDERGEYHEIKGWVVQRDRTKWARMKKYYPDVKLVVIGHGEYRRIKEKWASAIPTWETVK